MADMVRIEYPNLAHLVNNRDWTVLARVSSWEGGMGSKESFPWERGNEFLLKVGGIHEPYRFCVTALEEMHSLVEFDEGVFLMLDGNRRIVRKYFSNIPRRWSNMYLEYFSRSATHEFDLRQDVSESFDETYVRLIRWDDFSWIHDDFMDGYIRARGLRQSLSFVLFDLEGSPASVFSLDRVMDERSFTDRDIRIVRTMVAHLNNFYKNLFVRPAGQVRIWEGNASSDELTPREREVTDLICQGVTPANISRKLHISIGTTNKHIAHIYKKYGVGSRQELLVRLLGK